MSALIDQAKSQGVVGEQADGYLGIVSGGDAALRSAVAEINTGRAAAYKDIAAQAGLSEATVDRALHGAFGAMGGLVTSANDYARWIAFLISAWPARAAPSASSAAWHSSTIAVTPRKPAPPLSVW